MTTYSSILSQALFTRAQQLLRNGAKTGTQDAATISVLEALQNFDKACSTLLVHLVSVKHHFLAVILTEYVFTPSQQQQEGKLVVEAHSVFPPVSDADAARANRSVVDVPTTPELFKAFDRYQRTMTQLKEVLETETPTQTQTATAGQP